MAIRVLLADDHTVVLDGLRGYLQAQRDVNVVGAVTTGREAVAAAQKLTPDVVLMDISMPDLDGIDATLEIRKTCPATQVVIFSMYATRDHISEALRSGARGYVLKDSDSEEIVRAVREAHAGRRFLSQKIADSVVDGFLVAAPGTVSPLQRLSRRERQVLKLLAAGKSSPEVAEILHISRTTVVTYRSRIMQKLDIHTLAELVKFALQNGLTDL
jgi:DNA-binding NarL/FixJ family response regulator